MELVGTRPSYATTTSLKLSEPFIKIKELLTLASKPGRTNLFVVCPDELGLGLLLQGALATLAAAEDVHFHDAENLTKEKARQIETEARMASRGSSILAHFYIYKLQRLSPDSVGPLLKAVEEARFARFIFQAQSTPRKIHTLMSRSSVAKLPFLTKKAVLGNLKALNYDAKTADLLDLYDGTLSGTIKALSMKDTLIGIQRETTRGLRGLAALYTPEILNSLAFDPAMAPLLNTEEHRFLDKNKSLARQKLALYAALDRVTQ